MPKLGYGLCVGLMLVPLVLSAGEVFRTVDSEGNVTYTDTPPDNGMKTQRVEIHEGPSQESIRHTQERNDAIRKAMEEARDQRLEKEASRREMLESAQDAVDKAEQNLKETQEMNDDDRENVVGGRSRIRPEYFERVKKAEDELKAARDHLKDVRGY
ncbi:MAG: DUF4124 domain-containing protein [Candidatus Thiodiazotropha sp.]